jgi:diguanylate cyclase (GGDEF)-like protein/PAS domain S-box-containing protein
MIPDPDHLPDATPTPPEETRGRSLLARKWAYLLLSTVFQPLPQSEFERELLALLDGVCDDVYGEPFDTTRSHAAGVRLVELGCTVDEVLPRTVDTLGRGLLAQQEFRPERYAERIVLAVGALASGFAEANRRNTFEQQESIKLSLLKAVRDAKWTVKESEARFDEVTMSVASGILIADLDGRLTRVNAAIAEILGYSSAELTGINLFDIVHPDYAPALREDYRDLLDGNRDRIRQSQRLLCKDGEVASISLTATLLRDGDDRPGEFVTVIEDGTELFLLQNELSRQALHDVLTGLPNRQFFGSHVERALRRADREHGITLCHLDLDAFAVICNGLGHRVGEHVLTEVGRRLTAAMSGENAMVARFESDEFAILVENTATTPAVARMVAHINDKLAEPINANGHRVAVSASIGVVHRPSPNFGSAEVLRAADTTLRRAMAAGRGQWKLFAAEQDERDRRTDTLAAAMPGAWADGRLGVGYRPMASLASGAVAGVEALLRWDHPDLGTLPHDRCVELAELTGLSLPLGEWLLRTMCSRARWWQQRLGDDLPLAVALTAHQSTDAELVSRIVGVLDDTRVPPTRLTVWLPVHALSDIADNVRALAELGVQTGLSDFGAAVGDLALLADLQVRSTRLARRLVTRQAEAEAGSPLTSALAAIGPLVHRAGATVVVDGIDTREQADWWRSAGADLAIGDLFSGLAAHFS